MPGLENVSFGVILITLRMPLIARGEQIDAALEVIDGAMRGNHSRRARVGAEDEGRAVGDRPQISRSALWRPEPTYNRPPPLSAESRITGMFALHPLRSVPCSFVDVRV